jgi:hypothetical protein
MDQDHPTREEAAEMLAGVERGRDSLARRLRVPRWHVALQGLALAVLFLLPGLACRPGHELRGTALVVPIALTVAALTLLDNQLGNRRGVRLRSDRARAYPSVKQPLLVSGAVVLLGALATWAVALDVNWIASFGVGLLAAAAAVKTRLAVAEATLEDIRAGRTQGR